MAASSPHIIPRFPESHHPWSLSYLKLVILAWASRLFVNYVMGMARAIKKMQANLPQGVNRTRMLVPARDGSVRMIRVDRYEKVGTTEEDRKQKKVHLNFHGCAFYQFSSLGQDFPNSPFSRFSPHRSAYIAPGFGMDALFLSRVALVTSNTHTVYDVDYRKAPEHPFPAALNDALDVVAYLLDFSNGIFSMSGFSSGGHLAMGTSITLPIGMVNNLTLFYPNPDRTTSYPPPLPLSEATSGLTRNHEPRKIFTKNCCILPEQPLDDPKLSPTFAPIERWPKHVWITCGDADPNWEPGRKLIEKLEKEGVDARFVTFEKGGHAFDRKHKKGYEVEGKERVKKIYAEVIQRIVKCG